MRPENRYICNVAWLQQWLELVLRWNSTITVCQNKLPVAGIALLSYRNAGERVFD